MKKKGFVSHRYNFPFGKYSQFRPFSFRPQPRESWNGEWRMPTSPHLFTFPPIPSHAFARVSKEKPGHEIFNGHSTTHVLSMARSKRRNSAISTRNIALPIFHLPFPLKIITSSIVKFVKNFFRSSEEAVISSRRVLLGFFQRYSTSATGSCQVSFVLSLNIFL